VTHHGVVHAKHPQEVHHGVVHAKHPQEILSGGEDEVDSGEWRIDGEQWILGPKSVYHK
jgi:hypothetical protein